MGSDALLEIQYTISKSLKYKASFRIAQEANVLDIVAIKGKRPEGRWRAGENVPCALPLLGSHRAATGQAMGHVVTQREDRANTGDNILGELYLDHIDPRRMRGRSSRRSLLGRARLSARRFLRRRHCGRRFNA